MEDRSGLFNEISGFSQRKLKKVETNVITGTGEKLIEKRGAKGLQTLDKSKDTNQERKLDLQVGLVVPGLMIGSQDVAHKKEILDEYSITHILNLAKSEISDKFEDDYNYLSLNIKDAPDFILKDHYDECFDFIDEGKQRGNCFVHCSSIVPGLSRATAICVAYLMTKHKRKYQDSYNEVKEARPFVRMNDGFMKQLIEYDNELFGKQKKDDIEDPFTLKKKQEIEAEKQMLKNKVSIKDRLRIFGGSQDKPDEPKPLRPFVTRNKVNDKIDTSAPNKRLPPNQEESSKAVVDNEKPVPKRLNASIFNEFNKTDSQPVRPVSKWKSPNTASYLKKTKSKEFNSAVKRNRSKEFQKTELPNLKPKNESGFKSQFSKQKSIDKDEKEPSRPGFLRQKSKEKTNNDGKIPLRPALVRQKSNDKASTEKNMASNIVQSEPMNKFTEPCKKPENFTSSITLTPKSSPRPTPSPERQNLISMPPKVASLNNTIGQPPPPPPPPPIPPMALSGKLPTPSIQKTQEPRRRRSNELIDNVNNSETSNVPRQRVNEPKDTVVRVRSRGNVKQEPQSNVPVPIEKKDEDIIVPPPKAPCIEQKTIQIKSPAVDVIKNDLSNNKSKEDAKDSEESSSDYEEDSEEEESEDDEEEEIINFNNRRSSQTKGLTRSSTSEIFKLIKSKTKADSQGPAMDAIDEDDEIDTLLSVLQEEVEKGGTLEDIDWEEMGIGLEEVKEIVNNAADEEDDEDEDEYTDSEDDSVEEVQISLNRPKSVDATASKGENDSSEESEEEESEEETESD